MIVMSDTDPELQGMQDRPKDQSKESIKMNLEKKGEGHNLSSLVLAHHNSI